MPIEDRPLPALQQSGLERVPGLPPLAARRRIVGKVDASTALYDWLEARLTATAARLRLLNALLIKALTPLDDRELEAAE